ncbi:MAG: PAS domain S-box protein [Bacteroidota bacterium]
MGSWEFNLITGKVCWSKSYYLLVGQQPGGNEVSNDAFDKMVHPADKHLVDEKLTEIYQNREPASLDLRLILPDGKVKWVQNNMVPVFDGDTLIALKGVNIDITEKKLAEQEIRNLNENLETRIIERTIQLEETNENLKNEIGSRELIEVELALGKQRLASIIEGTNVGTWEWNIQTGETIFNERWAEILGYTLDEIPPEGIEMWAQFFHPDDLEKTLEMQRKHFQGELDYFSQEYRMKHKNGDWIWILNKGKVHTWDQDGKPLLMSGTHQDITERKLAEHELKQVSTRLALAAKAGGVGVWDYDLVNDILVWDDQMFALYGIEKKDFSGAYDAWQSGLHPEDKERGDAEIQMAIRGQKEFDTEFRVVWPDGSVRNIRALAIVQHDSSGKPLNLIGTNWDITAQKQAEILLDQTRRNYETFFNTIDDFLFVLNEQGNIIHANETVTRRLGYKAEELLGESILMVHPVERREEAGRIVGEMLAGTAEFCPVPLVTKSGDYLSVETRVKPGFWDGKPAIFGVTKDITKIKLSEEKFSKAFRSNSTLMAISTLDGVFIDVNDTFLKTLGYSLEEVIGNTSRGLGLGLFENTEARKSLAESMEHNIPVRAVELNVRTKSSEIRNGLFSADTIYIGKDLCLLTMMVDITERKHSEEALKESEARFSSFMDYLPAVVFLKDHEGRTLFVNRYMEDAFGASNWIGKTMLDVFPNEVGEKLRSDDIDSMQLGYQKLEESMVQLDGKLHHYETQKFTIDRSGQEPWLGGISLDITERKHAEEEIIKSREEAEKANRAKSEFLSRMSHELRTPMNSILGFAQLMNMGELNPKQKKSVNHILTSGKHLLGLIDEILDISRIESGRLSLLPEPVQLSHIIIEAMDTVQPLADARQIKLELENSPDSQLFVMSDRKRLKQVLINLLNNAVKYNRQDGAIFVKTKSMPQNDAGVVSARISITDTGLGIHPDDIPKLFIPFERIGAEQTYTEGTGLGLAVVKKIMDSMEGAVGVESVVGKGSTFWIELPITEQQISWKEQQKNNLKLTTALIVAKEEIAFQNEEKAERAGELVIANKELVFQNKEKAKRAGELVIANKELAFQNEEKAKRAAELVVLKTKYSIESATTVPAKTGTILYIEDNIQNAELVEEIIGDYRPEIKLISSVLGEPSVKLATDNMPDLILLDLNLPDMDGSEVLTNLLADDNTKSIPVVILTADATQHQIEKLMTAGAKDYLIKPLDINLFIMVVDEWIEHGK